MTTTKFPSREGYWFSDRSGKLPHGDGREYAIGVKLSVKGKLVICGNALHGSFDPFDALPYAKGPMLHKVLFTGERIEHSDKVGSRSRTILVTGDAEDMLRRFARRQALSVAHLWKMPPVVREYLETGEETLRNAARDAAWGAALSAAWDAAWGASERAAWHAAESAAWGAAWGAVRNAALSAVRNAAWGAAWDAVWSDARKMFNEMVTELLRR